MSPPPLDRERLIYVALGLAAECEATAKRAMLLGARLRAMALRPTIEVLEDDLVETMREELQALEENRLVQEGYADALSEMLNASCRR